MKDPYFNQTSPSNQERNFPPVMANELDAGVSSSQSDGENYCVASRLEQGLGKLPLRRKLDSGVHTPNSDQGVTSSWVPETPVDGFNWRKYGQKLVKGNAFSRSYYKCTYANCSARKQVERSHDGHITEINYLSKHEHPKPLQNQERGPNEPSLTFEETCLPSSVPPTESIMEVAVSQSNEIESEVISSPPDAKRQKKESAGVKDSAVTKTNYKPRVVVMTTSPVDIVHDGYRWRKYGQKQVKGNPNPRNYYRCTNDGCPVRKQVERASHDEKVVVTTYEGNHDHEMPSGIRTLALNAQGNNNGAASSDDGEPRPQPEAVEATAVNEVDSADGSHAIQGPPNLYDMSPHVDSGETGMPAKIDMSPIDSSADMSHAVEDPNNNNSSNDISLHADSDQMGIPAANDLMPHIESADGSHADEDPNGTGPNHVSPNVGSAELGIPAGNSSQENAQDTTPAVQHVASPVSDHSVPAIPEIHSDFQLIQQPSENGIQDQEVQADPTPMVEIEDDNMQHVEAIQVDEIIPEDSSLNPHDEPSLVMSTNPTITENQAAVLPTSEVLVQTTATPITAQTQIQNASLLEQYMFYLQQNANSNQVGSLMTPRVDPLQIEVKQLYSVKEKMVKSYDDNIQKINIDFEKEKAEAIAKIRLKYSIKRQEADATFNSQKKEAENNMNTVFINGVLAAAFKKCRDVTLDRAELQQACQALQQLHRFHGPLRLPGQSSGTQQTPPPPPPPISATATETPPQQTQPPLQIVHQPSALFSTPLTRHPHTTTSRTPPINNPVTPPIAVSSRPPTITNLIIPSITTNRPPMINPTTPSIPTTTNRPLTTITQITPSTTPSTIISSHGMNHLTPSTTPIRPLIRSNSFRTFAATSRINTETCGQSPQSQPLVSSLTHSTAPHMRPLVSREIRTPGPHMRPLASSDVRSSTSHMRPSNPTSSSGPPGSGTYHRTLSVQHVTSSLPLTSPSNSQPLNSTSSVQPLPPLPHERFPVPPPPQPRSESPQPPPPSQLPLASADASSLSSLPRGPSVPQSGGPQDKLNDNVSALTDNAARGPNILKTPEFPGGVTAAQPPSAREVVYLSDDD